MSEVYKDAITIRLRCGKSLNKWHGEDEGIIAITAY